MSDATQLVKVYIKIRDAKAEKQRELDAEIKVLDDQLDLIGQQLLEICKTTGQEGGKTEHGSFTRKVSTRYDATNWEAMHKFIRDHDAFDLLERRVSQGNMREFLHQNPDTMPEGMNVVSKYSVTVRRATK